MIEFDTTDLRHLRTDLGKVTAATARLAFAAFAASGEDLKATWATKAKETAGAHGRLYPKSITTDVKLSTDIIVEVGPDPRLPQGGMSFEFGSVNQPPHLDGQKSMDEVLPRLEKRVNDALAGIATALETGNTTGLRAYTTKAGITRMASEAQIANWTRGRAA